MINNALFDGKQYIYTSLHCIDLQTRSYEYALVGFNYQSDQCNEGSSNFTINYTAQGLNLIAYHEVSDFALLEVLERIPESYNVYLSGWSIQDYPPKSVFCLHHPAGDMKKISISKQEVSLGFWKERSRSNVPSHWVISNYEIGIKYETYKLLIIDFNFNCSIYHC